MQSIFSSKRVALFLSALGLWCFALLTAWHMDVMQKRTRLLSEKHVLETVSFYVRERQALPLKAALESLRQESGYTALSLCHRGKAVLKAGEAVAPCRKPSSVLVQSWQKSLPLARGYVLTAETRLVTLTSSLIFFVLALSMGGGLFYIAQVWHKASLRRDPRTEMKLKIKS